MTLPDFSPIDALDDTILSKLKARLVAVGLTAGAIEPILGAARGVHPLLRRPVLHHHLRSIAEPYAYAARALMFGDPIEQAELRQTFGELLAPLVASGLLREVGAGFVSPFTMSVVDGLFCIADLLEHAGEAVMGLGPLTIPLCAAVKPAGALGKALDLGCGAGVVALLLARRTVSVVATDINPRAVAMTRFNARFNGVSNVEVRLGSLFEPVARDRFDLVASQPPFIPQSDDARSGDFMSGGKLGDELVLSLLDALPDHLVPGGRAVIVAEWGHGPRHAAPGERLKKQLPNVPADVMLFEYSPVSLAVHAAEYSAALHPTLGEAYELEALRRLKHGLTMGIDELVPSLVVVRRVDDRRPRFEVLRGNAISTANSRRLDAMLLAREAVRSLDSLLDSIVCLPEGATSFDLGSSVRLELPPQEMLGPIEVTGDLMALYARFGQPATVRAAIDRHLAAGASGESPQSLAKQVASALLNGHLEVQPRTLIIAPG